MLAETAHCPVALPARLLDPLRERGFVRNGRLCAKDGLAFASSGQWHVLRERSREGTVLSPFQGLGEPGLWKWVQNGEAPHRVFEIPAWTVSDQAEEGRLDESGPVAFGKLLDWALQTRQGRVPESWCPPDATLVGSWIGPGALTVQTKGCVRQGESIQGGGHWSLRMPIVPRLVRDLPEPRRRALEELVADAQRRWAMVRIGVPALASPAVLAAEVDLTGAPHSELLFSTALDVLRHVVAWLVETAEVLSDPAIEIACLAPGGEQITGIVERKTP